MMYRLLQLFRNQPQLLADHAAAYGELVVTEIGDVSAVWKRQAMLIAMGLSGLGVAVVLAGVALMLWVVMPAAVVPVAWTLACIPAVPAVLAAGCLLAARRPGVGTPLFDNVRRQVRADVAMLREVNAS